MQTLATEGDLCSVSLPGSDQYRVDHTYASASRATSRYIQASGAAMPFFSLNLTIDANTGLPSAGRDTAGLLTTYEYDSSGRLLWLKPQAGHGSWVQFSYTAPEYIPGVSDVLARVAIRQRPNGSTSGVLASNRITFDDWGRAYREFQLMPDGSESRRQTLYDDLGRKDEVGEWNTVGLGAGVTRYTYDAFGRPTRITPPDGSAHDVTLTYTGDLHLPRISAHPPGRTSFLETEESPAVVNLQQAPALSRSWRAPHPLG